MVISCSGKSSKKDSPAAVKLSHQAVTPRANIPEPTLDTQTDDLFDKEIMSEHNISRWLSNHAKNLFLICCSFRKRHFENWKFPFWNILTLH